MDHLIPLVNKLQDVFGAIGQQQIDLPQITVVGSQSAGKSSVLEHIVGRDFLPRGNGICTRRPLVLQLYNTGVPSNGKDTNDSPTSKSGNQTTVPAVGDEWGEFLHLPGQRFFDFNEIRNEIIKETDRLTGKNKGISNKSINLKIYSPHVLNLTLVDLPGITKVPTGDQPENVEEQIHNMCMEFISNPNAIILAVTGANQDLVNSDGLKLARMVDPEGVRTIGVLTKVDIMDQGTDCCDILNNNFIPLRRGYIAVINRSQKDIMENVTIRQALMKEQTYFQTHPKYRTLLSKCGTNNLTRTLNHVLIHHIKECLPDIRNKVVSMMNDANRNMASLGESPLSNNNELGKTLLKLISVFSSNFKNIVEGNDVVSNGNRFEENMSANMTEIYGGARIAYIFNETFVNKSIKQMNPFEGLEDVDIRTAIANANGARGPSLFVPEQAFEWLVRKQIERLREPGLQCIDYVFDEIQRMAYHADCSEISRFPHLRDRIFEVVNKLLRGCMVPTQVMITNLIEIELGYINTSHPDFCGGRNAVNHINKKFNNTGQAGSGAATGNGAMNGSHAGGNNGAVPGNLPPAPGSTATGNPAGAVGNTNPASAAASPGAVSTLTTATTAVVAQVVGASANAAANNASGGYLSQAPDVLGNIPGGGFFGLWKPATANPTAAPTGNNPPTAMVPANPNPNYNKAAYANPNPTSNHHGYTNPNANPNSLVTGGVVKLPPVPERMKSSQYASDKEKVETELIKTLVASYFDIVRKNYMDMVPKSIMHFLVNCFKDKLQNELVAQLYRDTPSMEYLLRESEDIASRRKSYKEMKDLLLTAMEILNEVRDYHSF